MQASAIPSPEETKADGNLVGHDAVRRLIYGDCLPKERAGYIVARYALLQESGEYANLALHTLTDEKTAPEHQPPLSDITHGLIRDFLEDHEDITHYRSIPVVAKFLLTWALDEGQRL